ncbi:MAG: dephospho-CoA kinase [Hymenobacteraceae bacterium]|nr:dephospho-CoA kinase [Hymenobacteraceae bacterium]MDX5394971.1 dephospho-CoA kinase [Hymenobacteraceae bacterium]MDX5442753.1 dephospho-CoA kinase [Hymenobacteraceae bacterium]MDX5511005.1 dephospho-CoA kinase [Hymenobacteraceae bacterium]
MLKIGITGGIGSGKSVVCRVFQLLGVPVYDSDARAKWVMANDQELHKELTKAFGAEVFDAQHQLNRTYLAQLVFNNPEQLNLLNSLVHPHVGRDFTNWMAAQTTAPYVLKEAALMFESNAWKQMDKIITVYAPLDVRIDRVLKRDPHRTRQDIQNIIDKQLQEEEKLERADFVVYNDDTQLVIPQVLNLHQQFLEKHF